MTKLVVVAVTTTPATRDRPMRNLRHGNTSREMLAGGTWVKVGRRHYRHVSGAEVKYDCGLRGWATGGWLYASLWAARDAAERAAARAPCSAWQPGDAVLTDDSPLYPA
jgi:hypothetical protein